MMNDFIVIFEEGYCKTESKVYHIDANTGRFLVTNFDGYFMWVDVEDCRIKGEIN